MTQRTNGHGEFHATMLDEEPWIQDVPEDLQPAEPPPEPAPSTGPSANQQLWALAGRVFWGAVGYFIVKYVILGG